MDIFCIKHGNALHPASEPDRMQLKKIKSGHPVRMTLRRVRNYEFHKKFFALLNLAFENWEPERMFSAREAFPEAQKNFDRFRKDLIILAGYYDVHLEINGRAILEAKSISFANMDQDQFDKLYEATLEAIRTHVFKNMSDTDLQLFLNELEQFA